MIKSLYTTVAGMMKDDRKIESISSNISNISTNGFKKQMLLQNEYSNQQGKSPKALTNMRYDFTQGSVIQSMGTNDFAINGEGFFRVELPNGDKGYTRNGALGINQEGILVTSEGYKVLAQNNTTNEEEYVYANASEIHVSRDGSFTLNNEQYNFNLVTFNDLQGLERVDGNIFRTNQDEVPVGNNASIYQGYLESSNVDAAVEYSDLIIANRSLQSSYNSFKNVDELVQKSIEEVGKL